MARLSRAFKRLLVFAFVATVGLLAAAAGVGLLLYAPAHSTIEAPPAELNAQAVEFPSASGATIRGWFVAGQPGRGVVVLMHGLRGNRLPMVRRALALKSDGYAVLLFDFQAHGASGGSRITFGYREGQDAAAAIAFAKSRAPNEKVGVIGTSLGGAAALLSKAPVDALVLEAVYPDIRAATANRVTVVLGERLGVLLAQPLASVLEIVMAPILGVAPSQLRPIDRMAEIGAPVLLLGGTADDRTPPDETSAMFDRAAAPKYIWMIQGAGHTDFEQYAPALYREHVLGFLGQYLRARL